MPQNHSQTQNFIYGIHPVAAFLKINAHKAKKLYSARQNNNSGIQKILELANKHKINLKNLSTQELNELLPNINHQGIALEIDSSSSNYNESELPILLDNLEEPPFLLILDSVQDPHNLGACLRTANAAGVHAVIAPKDKAVGITPVVRKVACGAAETTPFFAVTNLARTLDMLKKRGIWLFGTSAEAKQNIYEVDMTGALAIVLGAEGAGLRRLTSEKCDFLVSIPLFGTVSSLNVSVATGICLFEAVRRKLNV